MLGLAIGDAVGACVESFPHERLVENPVRDIIVDRPCRLPPGYWTDDTSMALCLASSLISRQEFDPYNQMVRYKWWYRYGYLSSTGVSFGSGRATRQSLREFSKRQYILMRAFNLKTESEVDHLSFRTVKRVANFDVTCGRSYATGNGALMRLAPIPLYFFRNPRVAIELCGRNSPLTHGSRLSVDACRYYGALIVATLNGETKQQLLSNNFSEAHRAWFGRKGLCKQVLRIASGSYKRPGGYSMGIRGTGYVLKSLEAALWVFWSDQNSFRNSVLAAVNLGDDADTTAAIYGQLAGSYYGQSDIPSKWLKILYAKQLIVCMSDWIHFLGLKTYLSPMIHKNMHYHVQVQMPKDQLLHSVALYGETFRKTVPRPINSIFD
ncbi:unnamed protein product [Rotaria sp. Silwood1]|nr:unnamed protein product [Rotaria sp. Silwood1]CAF4963885.1 unnamed protein product [Rotaria sp. Silwood1]